MEKRRIRTYGGCLLMAAALLLICTKSSPLYPLNDWVDVNIYFTIGKGMFRGMVPYRDLYDQKGPVVYLLYGLCSLVSGRSFLGVWLLEIFSFSAFLYSSYRLMRLWAGEGTLTATALLAALTLPAMSISHGGSWEQICLPIFSYGLLCAVRYYRTVYPDRPKLSMVFVNGLLAGLLLLSKFTLLAFYFAWMAVLAVSRFAKRDWGYGFACCGVFIGAMLLTGVPWVIYFARNGAMGDFLHYYFVSNLFGYSYIDPPVLPNTLLAIVRGTGATLLRNAQYGVLIGLGILWLTFCKSAGAKPIEKIQIWLLAGFTACGLFIGGQGYRYYGIPLMVFAPLGLAPLLLCWNSRVRPKLSGKGWAGALAKAAPALVTVLGLGFALLTSPNVYLLGTPWEETPQGRFALAMERRKTGEKVTLLCRAFPDSGFYLAADVLPQCRFFTSTNVPLPEIALEQVRQLQEGIPQFAITRDREDPPEAGYGLLDQCSLYYEEDVRTYYLYEREGEPHEEP